VHVIPHDISRYLAFADALADAARAAILPHFRTPLAIESKGAQFDPVTVADRDAERAMRALIDARYPDHGVLGEEYGVKSGTSAYQWVLDPIDGTTAFISGLPLWGVLIALNHEGTPILGVMDQPYLDERYRGWNDGASIVSRGGERTLQVRSCVKLSDAILSTTDATLFVGEDASAFDRARSSAKLTRYGNDCYAYAMIASGHIDCVIEADLDPFDIQALIPIIRGAGGGVVNWSGAAAHHGGNILAYGDERVRDDAIRVLAAQ
jgi:histidinol phosphatase-like enzyme (inositol monophosphatase family)